MLLKTRSEKPSVPSVGSVVAPKTSSMRPYRADIQGLRGLAVSAVIIYHARASLAPGGYVGVDIFFVISGFVIAALIRRDLNRKTFSLRSFYRRRILRLYPALFVTLGFTIIAGAYILSPADLRELGRTTVSTVFFASNFDFMRLIGYFNNEAGLKPLLHMWSLGVEEQFYLVFPVILMLGWKFLPERVPTLIAGILITSLGLELRFAVTSPQSAFYLPFCRAFEFTIGAILAWTSWKRPRTRFSNEILSLVGMSLICIAILDFDETTRFPGLATLVPCLGAAVLVHLGPSSTLVSNVLGSSIPRLLGDASYSLYLWHWPVVVFARHIFLGQLNFQTTVGVLVTSILLGLLSWRFIEQPIRRTQRPEWPVFRSAFIAMGAFAGLGFALYISQGLPGRFSPQVRQLYESARDVNRSRLSCHGSDSHMIPYDENCIFGDTTAAPDVAIWGDSYGAELSVALGEVLDKSHRSAMEITASACPPTIDYPTSRLPCLNHNRDTVERLIRDNRIRTVILAASYPPHDSAEWPPFFSGFSRAIISIRAAGKRVGILFPIPAYEFDPPAVIARLARTGQSPGNYSLPWAEFEKQSGQAEQLLSRKVMENEAFAIRPSDLLCNRDICRTYEPSAGVLYFNRDHLSVSGARVILQPYAAQL